MSPEGTRVWRKTRRRALRGVPAGRRATHPVRTTYGRGQELAAWHALISHQRAAFREAASA
jgi:hypothetical protein